MRFSKIIATVVLVLLVSKAQAISTAALIQGIPSLAPMLEQVTPAVVSIRVSKAMTAPGHLYAIGAGSGRHGQFCCKNSRARLKLLKIYNKSVNNGFEVSF